MIAVPVLLCFVVCQRVQGSGIILSDQEICCCCALDPGLGVGVLASSLISPCRSMEGTTLGCCDLLLASCQIFTSPGV